MESRPLVENHQPPVRARMIATPHAMLLHDALDGARLDEVVDDGRAIRQRGEPVRERATEPVTQRNVEALLRPPENSVWNAIAQRASQHPLPNTVTELQRWGQRERELGDLV